MTIVNNWLVLAVFIRKTVIIRQSTKKLEFRIVELGKLPGRRLMRPNLDKAYLSK